jgi:hypothetical protein
VKTVNRLWTENAELQAFSEHHFIEELNGYVINCTEFNSRSALFWDITRRRVVIVYRRFGTTYRKHVPPRITNDIRETWLGIDHSIYGMHCIGRPSPPPIIPLLRSRYVLTSAVPHFFTCKNSFKLSRDVNHKSQYSLC